MKPRKITTKDVCEITGYNRNQLRALLRDLPTFVGCLCTTTSPRTFTRHELLTICVIAELETRFGMRRAAIGELIQMLVNVLQIPRNASSSGKLAILLVPSSVTYSLVSEPASEGVLIPLLPVLNRIEQYLSGDNEENAQSELALGPVALHKKLSIS